jgi:DNA-binding transcriptional ArsR family regulator
MQKVYRALSDPTRREILKLLRQRDMTAGELADHFPLAKPTLSKHFSILKEADLILSEKDGTSITYSLNLSVLEETLLEFLHYFQTDTQRSDR